MSFPISGVTDAGRVAIQRALDHNYPLVFTAIKTGNGIYTAGEDISGMTALKSQKNSYTIGSRVDEDGGITLGAVLVNYDGVQTIVAESYNINEIGLFCTVNGTEYLYGVAAEPTDGGREIPAYDGTNLTQIVQEWFVAISEDLEITVDMSGAFALAQDLKDLQDMIVSNHYQATIIDDDGNMIVDEDNNAIAGDWRYQIV